MSLAAVFVADAGERSGLGHLSRSSAVAVALRSRGIEVVALGLGAPREVVRDGVAWQPLPEAAALRWIERPAVLVLDSYPCSGQAALEAVKGQPPLVLMHDGGPPTPGVALVISPASEPGVGSGHLAGFDHACLRPAFWGLPPRTIRERVERVLVTTGGGDRGGAAERFAAAVRRALPDASVAAVRGPGSAWKTPAGVELIDRPDDLLGPLLEADLVLSAGGQTVLEAAGAGTPCLAVVLAENQGRQVERLAALGAVRAVAPDDLDAVERTLRELADGPGTRRELARRGQRTVDGYGALRVAYRIARL